MDLPMSSLERYQHGLVLKGVRMFDQALEDFRQAARDPRYAAKSHVQIALCLKFSGRQEDAIVAFRQALKSEAFSTNERVHIVYLLAQTLESLGHCAEALEAYGWIKSVDFRFRDVAQHIQRLSAGGRGSMPKNPKMLPPVIGQTFHVERRLPPYMMSCLQHVEQWLGWCVESLRSYRRRESTSAASPGRACQSVHHAFAQKPHRQPALRDRMQDARRHKRVPVRLRSAFSSKGQAVAGEGELRDLSPWGCRVTSPVAVPVGEDLECCIFPQGTSHPFIIDGATVRWINSLEFGLAFTNVRPGVRQQIAQLCQKGTVMK